MTSKIKVDNINKVSDDSNIIKKCGTTTTIGSGAGCAGTANTGGGGGGAFTGSGQTGGSGVVIIRYKIA